MTMAAHPFEFRPLTLDDVPRLHAWFNAPHAKPWFGERGTLEEITAEYRDYLEGREQIHPFVVHYENRPMGLMQWCRLGDFPDVQGFYFVEDPDAANCDVIIGEAVLAHRGLGAPMIRRFLQEIVFADARVTTCIIDPERENAIAIRAYEKAGFRFLRDVEDDGEGKPVKLLELTRAAFESTSSTPR